MTDARAQDVQRLVAAVVGAVDLASLPTPIAAAAFAAVPPASSSAPSSSAAADKAVAAAEDYVVCPATGRKFPKSAPNPHHSGLLSHTGSSGCHHGHGSASAAGSSAANCPYHRAMAVFRCPPIVAVLSAAAGAAAVIGAQAILKNRR